MFQPFIKYFQFSGRARRKEYWLFLLSCGVGGIITGVLDWFLGTPVHEESGTGALTGLLILLILIPGMSLVVRRLHDTDRSGWWILLGLIPFFGLIVFVFMCLNGTEGKNRFGPDPKAIRERTSDREYLP